MRTRLFVAFFAVLVPVVALAQTTPPDYERHEKKNVERYRDRVAYGDPYDTLASASDQPQRPDTTRRRPELKLELPPAIARLLAIRSGGSEDGLMEGFRIQVYVGSSRDGAQRQANMLANRFYPQPVYTPYERPYFKVRMGDFLTRREAEEVLAQVREGWPQAFVVPDRVKPPEE